MTVCCSHKFRVLSFSLHKSTSVSVWTPLLTCPQDVKLLQSCSKVGKPDVRYFAVRFVLCNGTKLIFRASGRLTKMQQLLTLKSNYKLYFD
jgi:hypothetical protein